MKEQASGAGGPRRLPVRSWLFDSALALVAASLSTGLFTELMDVERPGLPRSTMVLGYALVLLHTLPLAARRRFPLAVLVTSVASGLTFAAIGLPAAFLGLPILVPAYTVAAYGDRWVPLAGLAVAEVGLAAVQLTRGKFEARPPGVSSR